MDQVVVIEGQDAEDQVSVPAKQNKKKVKKEETRRVVKKSKKDGKRMPNIAQELAKNRNQVKGTSPSPANTLSSSPAASTTSDSKFVKEEKEDKILEMNGKPVRKESTAKMTQLKISSLLSPNENVEAEPPLSKVKSEFQPQSNSNFEPQSPSQQRQASNAPKVILPTQKPGGGTLDNADSSDTPGVLIARISSPVNLPVEKLQVTLKRSHSTSVTGGSKSNGEKAKKSNSIATVPCKSKTDNKALSEGKKKSTSKAVKKEHPAGTAAIVNTDKIENEKKDVKQITKQADKKDLDSVSTNGNKSADAKKKAPTKKEPTPATKASKTPKKLSVAPPIKSPSLLEVFERGKSSKEVEEPAIIMDVPLYSSKDNEYLDENGQVVFNFYKLVRDKFSPQTETNIEDVKIAKRNLLSQLNVNNGQIDSTEDDDEDDIVEVDEDGEEDEEDEGDEEKTTTSPKKKSHPNKGKSLIGKYDIEDPFIDDSELLWEEQRAATKDGFFVYFGPLIEKGHYASLERADGTMKRGGVKNK